jgi:putative heme-binding domain-containing protein
MLRPFSFSFALLVTAVAADPFAEGVRSTEPLTPEQQRAAFKVPDGFEVQLVAAEPDLRKPMNMAFDALGRLWVTESREYPFPAKPGAPSRDSIRVFSDFGPDGRARKVEVFADGLNIPIGLYPFRTGKNWKCIVWSIPNIWVMEDTDGDGKADKREVLFGPLGWEKDTHGNQASFRRGADGWLYGTHGFSNQSTYRAKDGSSISLNSGNTWRVRVDGSRVEQHTWGQVNPFGLCWDDRGNLFSADCHSSPIYQLLRGGWYPSFGKPHDGLGYAPQTVQHSHGSTAICGPIMVADPSWPAELQGHILIGNVMTSRLNHDAIEWHGSSSKGKELPDFLTSTDPWFRPVDLQWGPDGALYVADFYNRIIGHYEVPLTHPGRDRERGRIWRVVRRGALIPAALPSAADALVEELASGNPTRRSLALNELCDRFGDEAITLLKQAERAPKNPHQHAGALWALQRMGDLPEPVLLAALQNKDALVRTHAARVADARKHWSPALAEAVRARLSDEDAIVQRVATEALATHPAWENFQPLLSRLLKAPREDDHLIYSTRVALREHLRADAVASRLSLETARPEELRALLDVMLAVETEATALLRLELFERIEVSPEQIAKQLPSMVKSLPPERIGLVVKLGRKHLANEPEAQGNVLKGLAETLAQRALTPDGELRAWSREAAVALLATSAGDANWTTLNVDSSPAAESIWAFQERGCADGQKAQVLSSFPRGEQQVGVLRSARFAAPAKLRFYFCGHDGQPGETASGKNRARLCDAQDGRVLREAAAPRNDVAQRVEWDLADLNRRPVYFEVADGNSGSAYAWIAFGRFKPELPELALVDPAITSRRLALGADLARTYALADLAPQVAKLFASGASDPARIAAAEALVALDREKGVGPVARELGNAALALATREKLAAALSRAKNSAAESALLQALPGAPHKLQQAIAAALSTSKEGSARLLDALAEGKAAPALLRDKALADRLKAQRPDAAERIAQLTATLPPANAEADRTIAARRSAFDSARADAKRGAAAFSQYCATCHQIGQKGNLVGPQLDGIGARGVDRILEDVVDPNRNVDRAFRLSVVTLHDGSVISGLFRREEGATLVFADLAGKEQSVPKENVKSRIESDTSLMPPGLIEAIPAGDFNDLLAFLLEQKATH